MAYLRMKDRTLPFRVRSRSEGYSIVISRPGPISPAIAERISASIRVRSCPQAGIARTVKFEIAV